MADIETSVVISAQIDGLRSGMEAAANSVQAATDAMRAQLAGLGDIAQQAQSQLSAATGQVGSGIGALQSQAASLAGSMGALPGGNMQDSAADERCGKRSCLPTRNSRTTSRGWSFKQYKSVKETG